jgi:hypothetical protein
MQALVKRLASNAAEAPLAPLARAAGPWAALVLAPARAPALGPVTAHAPAEPPGPVPSAERTVARAAAGAAGPLCRGFDRDPEGDRVRAALRMAATRAPPPGWLAELVAAGCVREAGRP